MVASYLKFGLAALLASSCGASPLTGVKGGVPINYQLPNRTVTQFSAGVWIENIAVRPNGNLLLTSLRPNASVYEVSNPHSSSPTVSRRFTINNINSFLGIAETSPDVYAFVGGNTTVTTGGITGTWGVYILNLAKGPSNPKLVASLPEAGFLNGVSTVPGNKNLILVADSFTNIVWRIDISTGKFDKAAQFPAPIPIPGALAIGLNGIHFRDNEHVWYSNDTTATDQKTGASVASVYQYRVDRNGGLLSQPEVVATLPSPKIDDFAYGPSKQGVTWIVGSTGDKVFAFSGNKVATVAGVVDPLQVPIATAAQFGRTRQDTDILYVTTGAGTVNGTVVAGKVVALDTRGFCL